MNFLGYPHPLDESYGVYKSRIQEAGTFKRVHYLKFNVI